MNVLEFFKKIFRKKTKRLLTPLELVGTYVKRKGYSYSESDPHFYMSAFHFLTAFHIYEDMVYAHDNKDDSNWTTVLVDYEEKELTDLELKKLAARCVETTPHLCAEEEKDERAQKYFEALKKYRDAQKEKLRIARDALEYYRCGHAPLVSITANGYYAEKALEKIKEEE